MATIGNFIPSAPEISKKFIRAPSNFELKMEQFRRQGPVLASEPTRETRVRAAVEGYRSKRQLADLIRTARNMYESLKYLAMQKGLDIEGILRTFNTRQELAFANGLLGQLGVPPQSVSPDKIKSIIEKSGKLESFMAEHSEATLKDAVNYALSDDQDLQKALEESVEERFNKILNQGLEEPPEVYNKAGVYKWFKARINSGDYRETFLAPQSSLYNPAILSRDEYRELMQKVTNFVDNIPVSNSPSVLNKYFVDFYRANQNTKYADYIKEILAKTVLRFASNASSA